MESSKVFTLIITKETEESFADIIVRMIKSVMSDKIKIEVGPA